ncbi:MAG TPA: rod-binding protein [Thermotogota bacterium]|jgi:Rod binding domain-containing protein|nr:rod-binding protein [Thermotogota bacterium]NLH18887.1 hypothetical protein [Thermotogaceae bacterium]OQC32926.1 MAG: hypothetical protein BWX67_00038 [Thermotogota bacterium ADurb.Bin062]HNW46044.1 rod-binding protein [Thermotogota bacterium]HNY81605.1 rod-binding protein [Thermotogota bacterium]
MKINNSVMAVQNNERILCEKSKKPKDDELKEAVNEFVSILLSQIFKDMDRSIPRTGLTEESYGQSWFREMILDEYAKTASKQALRSLGETVYKQIAGVKQRGS